MPESVAASLTESLGNAPFPISKDELLRNYGQLPIQMDHGGILNLETALTRVEQQEFRSLSDLTLAIGELSRTDSNTHL